MISKKFGIRFVSVCRRPTSAISLTRRAGAVFSIVALSLFAMAGPSRGETPAATPAAAPAETPAAAGCPVADPKDPCDRDHMMGATNTLKELQAKLNNPLSSLWSLQLQNNFQLSRGAPSRGTSRGSWEMLFQPAMPVPLTENITWISRPIFTVVNTPFFDGDWDRTTGVGPFTYETWLTPTKSEKVQLALGGAIQMPMGTRDNLGSRKYSAGPSGVFVYKHKDVIVGGLANWLFSFAGTDNAKDVNKLSFQYFLTYAGLPNHWQLNMSPTITYDRKADGGNAWAVPIGLGLGKMVKFGKLPVKIQAEYNYYVVHPDNFGPRHLFTLKITPVIPALVKKALF
jgi:hypothetical protein